MVTPSEAATVAKLSERTLYRLIESGALHFVEDEKDRLMVCRNSVEQFSNETF